MKPLIGLLMIFSLVGCTASISGLPINQQNIEKLRINAAILAKTSPIQVAYLKAALGNDIARLPAEAVNCLDKIMAIAVISELSDEDLGTIAGLWDRTLTLLSPQILQQVFYLLNTMK